MTDRLLEQAWAAIGELAPNVIPLVDLAAELDDPLFSDLIVRLKQTVTTIGNTLSRLRAETDLNNDRDPEPTHASENGARGLR